MNIGQIGGVQIATASGAPADAVTGAGVLQPGSIYIDVATGNVYVNANTKASPTWAVISVATVSAAELAFLDGTVAGTQAASKAIVNDANANQGAVKATSVSVGASGAEVAITSTPAELNRLDDDNAVLSTLAGTGITGGTGTIYKTSVIKIGALYFTTIYVDLTGLQAIATDGDVIGDSTNPAHLGRITAARNGTIESMRVTCEEAPAGASADIDFFRATVATAVKDDAMAGVTGQAVAITAGGNWANGTVKCATAVPAANDYLYVANGAGAGNGTYTAGKFRIEILGY